MLCDSNQKALTDARTKSVDLYNPVEWNGQTYYAVVDRYTNVPAGDYYYGLQFAQDTQVIVDVEQINNASIQSKATITAGFTKKLSVSGAKVKSWTSRDKSIATVDKSGKVTAKKKGKTKIVATLTSGEKIDCTVTVAANNFSNTKATLNDCEYGKWGIAAYRASFDKSGNLVVKTQCVNNNGYKRLVELRNIKIVVKDVNDKTVGTYKASKMAVNVSPESAKGYTFTIKKSDLKKKKADLRNGTITVDANGYGR
ncbi:MAG: SLAP domain-containing protein [Lachnobacterium sp.]|nr:SLAP domain-containing protein [Lachnobacterium sp.]